MTSNNGVLREDLVLVMFADSWGQGFEATHARLVDRLESWLTDHEPPDVSIIVTRGGVGDVPGLYLWRGGAVGRELSHDPALADVARLILDGMSAVVAELGA